MGIWGILSIISFIGLIVFWRKGNAVWGGLTIGVIIGLIIAIVYFFKGNGFSWTIISKGLVVGVLIGIVAQLLGIISDKLKNINQ